MFTDDAREKALCQEAQEVAKQLGRALQFVGFKRSDGGVGFSGRWKGNAGQEGEYHPGPSITRGARPTYQDHSGGLFSVVDSNSDSYHSNSFRLFFRLGPVVSGIVFRSAGNDRVDLEVNGRLLGEGSDRVDLLLHHVGLNPRVTPEWFYDFLEEALPDITDEPPAPSSIPCPKCGFPVYLHLDTNGDGFATCACGASVDLGK